MRCCGGALGVIIFLSVQLIAAELQGPLLTRAEIPEEFSEAIDDNVDENERSEPIEDREEVAFIDNAGSETMSTDRKASPYAPEPNIEYIFKNGEVNPQLMPLFDKLMALSELEMSLHEKREFEKVEEGLEKLENDNDVEPTADKLEAENLFLKAKDLLEKPGDKRLGQALLRKAAEMKHRKARIYLAFSHLFGFYFETDFDYVSKEVEELAKEGVADANMVMAFLHSVGVGGKNVSQPLALLHLTIGAADLNTFARMALGYRYSFGINVPMSCEVSLAYYKRVAKEVASKITFSSGPAVHRVRLLDESENPGSQEAEIVDYYQLLADKGDVQSQVGLGQLYYQGGKAIEQDHQKALEYFTQAANSGNAIGYAFLGKLYLEGGENIKADNETAFRYFKRAADLGDPVGQSGLGLMYLRGLGVPKDSLKALNYFTQAADQGWVDGQLHLGNMYFTGNGVKRDYKLAFKYFNLASQSGHVLAYYNLGVMHAYGLGMLRSCPAAVEFFKNVAERGSWSNFLMRAYVDYKNHRQNEAFMRYAFLAELGYEVAQSNAAFLLDRGDVTIFNDRKEDLLRAFYYWKRAAAQGYSAAQVKLGDYYYYGWGTNVDFETAAALYRKASEQQYNAQAMFNLGYMHEQGLGMKKDWHLAKRLYDLAAETNADAKVPVALALMKLQLLTKLESMKETPFKFIFYLDEKIAANWDLYVIALLTVLLGVITYIIRNLQHEEQRLAEEINRLENEIRLENEVTPNPESPNTNASLNSETQPSSTPNNEEQQDAIITPPDLTAKPSTSSLSEPVNNVLRHRDIAESSTNASDLEKTNVKNTSTSTAPILPSAARSSTADPTD